MKKELSSRWREKLLFLSTSKAAITSAENQESERRVIKHLLILSFSYYLGSVSLVTEWAGALISVHFTHQRFA